MPTIKDALDIIGKLTVEMCIRDRMVFCTGCKPSLPPTISSHSDKIKSDLRDSGLSSSE